MRIASNKLQDLVQFYYSELGTIYEHGEIVALVQLVVEHFLGYTSTEMLSKLNSNINQSDLIKLYDCCKGLKKQIPLQYILKEAWFYDFKFRVTSQVLIPRPETEELVHLVISENKFLFSLLDIGTGSGCIPITIKKKSMLSTISACDISPEALNVAQYNANTHQAEINFFEGDILQTKSFLEKIKGSFNVIISNPPYIKLSEKKDIENNVLLHEPHLALFVEGEDTIIFYKKIIGLCKTILEAKGILYFELNPLTAQKVEDYAKNSGFFKETKLIKDMSGKLRFFKGVKF